MFRGMDHNPSTVPTDAPNPGPLHRFAAAALTWVGTVQLLALIFVIIDLDPDVLTRQVHRASEAQIGTWTAVAGLAVFGTWKAVSYIMRTFVQAWDGFRHWTDPALATLAAGWLCSAFWSQDIFAAGIGALLLTMFAVWRAEAVAAAPGAGMPG